MSRKQFANRESTIEPPRDGEFFIDFEAAMDELFHRTSASSGEKDAEVLTLSGFIVRFPVLSLGIAIGIGVVVSSFAFNLA